MKYSIDFYTFLEKEKRCSAATLNAYTSDVDEFCAYLAGRGKTEDKAAKKDVSDYLESLKNEGRSMSTLNRKLASVRCYYGFLLNTGRIASDPTAGIRSPKIKRDSVEFLSIEEVETLLETPDAGTDKGIRDRAMLELMYATGIRASEVSAANVSDLNLNIGFISVVSEGNARLIPVGRPARQALKAYINGPRVRFIGEKEDDGALFVNFLGERISRQGIWKILKFYGEKAGLADKISPKILRNSFAAHMVQNGADLKSLQDILGHEDIAATKFFLSLTKNRIMDVYGKAFPRA